MNRDDLRRYIALMQRHTLYTVCGIVMLLSLGVAGYYLKDASAVEEQYDAISQEGTTMLDTRKSGPTLREQLEIVRDAVQRIDASLVDEFDTPGNRAYFEGIARRARVQLDNLQALNPPVGRAIIYKPIPFTVSVSGGFTQVQTFLFLIETGPKFANLSSFAIRRIPENPSDVTLELNLELLGKP